jgi:hypothetical protein
MIHSVVLDILTIAALALDNKDAISLGSTLGLQRDRAS